MAEPPCADRADCRARRVVPALLLLALCGCSRRENGADRHAVEVVPGKAALAHVRLPAASAGVRPDTARTTPSPVRAAVLRKTFADPPLGDGRGEAPRRHRRHPADS